MTIYGLTRRLDSLGPGHGVVTATLEAARQRARAWYDAGNSGPMPLKPLAPLADGAGRTERSMWRQIAEARARVVFDRSGRELGAIYDMSDAELLNAANPAGGVSP